MHAVLRSPSCRWSGRAAVGLALLAIVSPAPALSAPRGRHVAEPVTQTGQEINGAPVYQKTFVSPLYEIDRIYRSMKGPETEDIVGLGEPGRGNELLWITAQYTHVVSGDPANSTSPEFMCHSNLGLSHGKRHREIFGSAPGVRLFTLSQGQMEVRLPEGFGIPVMSRQPLELESQVLNLNEQPEKREVRHRITIEFVRQSDLQQPMKPLRVLSAQGMMTLDAQERHFGVSEAEADPEEHGPGCSVGQAANKRVIRDADGHPFIAHWVVKPGREENRTLVTHWMKVPFDTTVHFIAVHLHPFAESASLVDLTSHDVVFRSKARGPDGRIGLAQVDSYASEEGLPLYRDHEYELDSVYDNTSGEDQDAMAVMFLYVLDKAFKLPEELAVN